jgi:hypothetical protein
MKKNTDRANRIWQPQISATIVIGSVLSATDAIFRANFFARVAAVAGKEERKLAMRGIFIL